jgi:hypothetical protein
VVCSFAGSIRRLLFSTEQQAFSYAPAIASGVLLSAFWHHIPCSLVNEPLQTSVGLETVYNKIRSFYLHKYNFSNLGLSLHPFEQTLKEYIHELIPKYYIEVATSIHHKKTAQPGFLSSRVLCRIKAAYYFTAEPRSGICMRTLSRGLELSAKSHGHCLGMLSQNTLIKRTPDSAPKMLIVRTTELCL